MSDTIARLASSLADRYTIERELGRGGMATVYLAQDVKHRRSVAVKVLNPELSHALGPERFLREIEIAAGLHHPHILPLYDSGESDGFLYYVMPLAEGESLRERLVREKQLPIDDAVRIAREVADALSYAHSHGVIHRDIKPENILLESGHALVADFGIAKAISAAGERDLTGTGMSIGTPAYMSPEQAAGEKNLDGRADLYSLGCVLYEMLAGQPPFTGPTVESVIRQHMGAEPPAITNIRPGVPASVVAAIQRALSKTPADRFNPVAQFAEALQGAGSGDRGSGAPKESSGPRHRSLRPVLFAVAVVAVSWLGWRAMHSGDRPVKFDNIRQVTREPALEIQVAISPDGRDVAYASGYAGHYHVETRSVSGGRPLSLTGDWQGFQLKPRWMPDGQSIRFNNWPPGTLEGAATTGTATNHARGAWTIPRMGGQAVAAGTGAGAAASVTMTGQQRTLEVRADSAFARDADGRATLLYAGFTQVHSAAWSPDGSRLAFVIGNTDYVATGWGNKAPSAIWVVAVGGTPVRVTHDSSLNVSPAWLAGDELLFVSDRDGPRDVYAVTLDRSGNPRGPRVRVTTGLEPYSVSVSADGRSVAYDRFLFRGNIYSLPIPRAGSVSIREARPVTALNQAVEGVEVSRDGKWLVFDSNLEGNQDIYVMPATGGEPRRVTRDPGGDFSPDFSPDGREIAFHSTRNGTRDIYLINADGTGEQRLTSDSGESYHPVFSPDGLRIAYNSFGSSLGVTWILRRDSIGGAWRAPELLVRDGGLAHWSPDNTRMVYEGRGDDDALYVLDLGAAARSLYEGRVDRPHLPHAAVWSADGRSIYFTATSTAGRGLYEIPASGGTPRLLVRFDDPAMGMMDFRGVAVGNGRFYFVIAEMQSDIYVADVVRR